MYVCPDCKTPLADWRCPRCAYRFRRSGNFPLLLSNEPRYASARAIVDAYESIYTQHSNAWENQGRHPAFIRYVSGLLGRFSARRLLEIGCGEGILLAATPAGEKYGTDLSAQALEKASARNTAQLSIALAERLPFADGWFDLVVSVGVMEHFLDDRAASGEICRVLEDGGHYVAVIHVHLTPWQSLRQKIAEYVFPRPHPLRLAKWLLGKLYQPIYQPVQNQYTVDSAQACLEHAGFVVTQTIHRRNTADAPLIGPHVIIYVCEKPRRRAA